MIDADARAYIDNAVARSTHLAPSKATPVDADEIPIDNSADSFKLYKLTWANLKATLKTYFDTVYDLTAAKIEAIFFGQAIKSVPVDADEVAVFDSADSGHMKQVTISGLATQILSATRLASLFAAQSSKTTPVDADEIPIVNSVGGVLNYLTWGNLKTALSAIYGTVTSVTSANGAATVTNTTTTPVITIVSAPKLTTARTIDGQSFDGTANVTVIAPGIHAATSKTTPVDADEMGLVDSAASNVLKKLTWANVKATLKSYFDPFYLFTSTIFETMYFALSTKSGSLSTLDEMPILDSADGHLKRMSLSTLQGNILTNANLANAFASASSKSTPVDADEIPLVDSVSGTLKYLTWANLKSTLAGVFMSRSNNLSDVSSVATARLNLHVPSRLFARYADAATTGITEQALWTDSIAANTLTANGDSITFEYTGITVANVNDKTLKVTFAGTTLLDTAAVISNIGNNKDWKIAVTLIRVSNTVVRSSVTLSTTADNPFTKYTEITSLALSSTAYNAVLLATTPDAIGDVTAKMGFGTYFPA